MLSLVIPTRNRPHFLRRLLQYYHDVGCSHQIVIADSSDAENLVLNQRVVDSFQTVLTIDHRVYKYDIEIREKLNDSLKHVHTPYTAVGADDDFLIPSSLGRAMEFLQEHSDYSIAHGDAVLFVLEENGAYGRIRDTSRYAQRSIENNTGAHRMLNHLTRYSPTWNSVQRTEFSREHYRKTVELETDLTFIELLPSTLSLIRGKTKKLDMLYMVRQAHGQQTSTNDREHQTIFDWIASPMWSGQYQNFQECLSLAIAQQDNISADQARSIVKRAFWSFTAIHLKSKWASTYRDESPGVHQGLRQIAARIPGLRTARRQLRSFLSGEENEATLPALLRPGSKHHSDFLPIYRAITEIPLNNGATSQN